MNDRISYTNKAHKYNNKKMPVTRNHSSSETTTEQKINTANSSSRADFAKLLMSANNVCNCGVNSWRKNTILLAGEYMIND